MESDTRGTTGRADDGTTVVADPVGDPFADWRSIQRSTVPAVPGTAVVVAPRSGGSGHPVPELFPDAGPGPDVDVAAAVAVLDDPGLVLSEGYVGRERRRLGTWAHLGRATWTGRRRMLRLDILIVLALVTMLFGALLLVASGGPSPRPAAPTDRVAAPAAGRVSTPAATAPSDVPPIGTRTPTTPPPAPAVATTDAQSGAAPGTPEAMGAAALALIRYPWQHLPGYSIVFRPIADAPSPGFYGNTSFTWGSTGGVSTLYVYPGETVERLAGITAFEIAHEVDAAYVEPRGGHDAIASLLGIHPASWAPQCDCAEQGYLSGWYAAAFSDYWSPGVGAWSSLAPVPSGAALVAMEPWLDPRIP